jgi:hypothetical protein
VRIYQVVAMHKHYVARTIQSSGFMLQVCTKCNDLKPASEFNRDKTKADGLQFRCKVWHSISLE